MNQSPISTTDRPRLPDRTRKPSRWLSWLALTTLAIVVGSHLPAEIARWHYAVYRSHVLDGDHRSALAAVERAIEWAPNDPQYWDAKGGTELQLDDYPASIKSFDRERQLLELASPTNLLAIAQVQNNSAYARALGGTQLERAGKDIEQSLEMIPKVDSWLDTRGFIRYLRGDLDGALDDLQSAISQSEETYRVEKRRIERRFENTVRTRTRNLQLSGLERYLAVLHGHRALIYEELGEVAAARRDFEIAEACQAAAARHE